MQWQTYEPVDCAVAVLEPSLCQVLIAAPEMARRVRETRPALSAKKWGGRVTLEPSPPEAFESRYIIQPMQRGV